MRTRGRLLALLLPACLSGCYAGDDSDQAIEPGDDLPENKSSLVWTPCEGDRLQGLECTNVEVPLNHADPSGEKITLALSRLQHTSPDYRGVILSHPGGPGGSGLHQPKRALILPNNIGAKYDWVSLDHRGVGRSIPRLDCTGIEDSTIGLPHVPQDETQIERRKQLAKDITENCAAVPSAKLLPHMHTSDLVQDIDVIRAELGVEKLTFFGVSFGTYVGQMYASMFPNRVDKMFLDGVLSPDLDMYESNLDQQRVFQKSTDLFFEWVAQHDEEYRLGTSLEDVVRLVYGKLEEARAQPESEGRHIDQIVTQPLVYAGYGVGAWPTTAQGLAEWIHGDNPDLLDRYGSGKQTNLHSIYLAVMCSETTWPEWEQTLTDAKVSHEAYPVISWHNTWFNAPCVNWPVPVTLPPEIKSEGVTFPILLTSETFDAATPIAGALAARERFPTSALVEGVNGSTHSTALFGSECTRQAIYELLEYGTVPPRLPGKRADRLCAPRPPSSPKPESDDAELPLPAPF